MLSGARFNRGIGEDSVQQWETIAAWLERDLFGKPDSTFPIVL